MTTIKTNDRVLVELTCEMCRTKFISESPQMCCNGRDCGCMGLPVDPIVCSDECYHKLMNKYKQNETTSAPILLIEKVK